MSDLCKRGHEPAGDNLLIQQLDAYERELT